MSSYYFGKWDYVYDDGITMMSKDMMGSYPIYQTDGITKMM